MVYKCEDACMSAGEALPVLPALGGLCVTPGDMLFL